MQPRNTHVLLTNDQHTGNVLTCRDPRFGLSQMSAS
jgi:hypothetical protein